MIQQLRYPVEDIARSDDIMTNDSEEIDYRYQPWEVVHHKEPKNKRYVLATDIYGFACIAWRMLSSIDSKPRCPGRNLGMVYSRVQLATSYFSKIYL